MAPMAPVTPVAPVASIALANGTSQQRQSSRAAASPSRHRLPSERPAPRVQGFRPINGRHRILAPAAAAAAQQPQSPGPQKKQGEKVLCVCTLCTSGGAAGKLVSNKTKHEHEHGDRINREGKSVDGDERCQGCVRKGDARCVRWEGNSKVCGNCARIKEKCSWNGESARKRDAIKRRNRAERAARLAQRHAETPLPDGITNGQHDAAQQPSPNQGEPCAGQQCPGGREKARSATPSPTSSSSRTAENASNSSPTRK
ncbi:uncharacterized protein LY79DRAFT_563189 [Colletotrichum navitas]|uniref:Uncharacterized protein n=1 Tax=Colletotrichum navitas TaxID=681940 RepID=A0AAD8V1L5_9PEZI|nr:uncharacterized protein LY79DRAFT_563189 [Colletotrichum navitas]KAK1579877.1 hypothetical protein LY79DRAFT_563189 [Colletotrichum navitas]